MQMEKDKKRERLCVALLYAAPIASSGIYGIIRRADAISILSDLVIALILATVYLTFLRVNQKSFYLKIKKTNETKTIEEVHHMRYFFRPELEFYLRESGFELLDNLDCMTLDKTSYNSWTSFFVAKAV